MIFGNIPIEPKQLVSELNLLATETAKKLDALERNTAWTVGINQALAAMARKRNFLPFYTDSTKKISEFLLDFVWWEQHDGSRRAALAVECEWGNTRSNDVEYRTDQVMEDFEK